MRTAHRKTRSMHGNKVTIVDLTYVHVHTVGPRCTSEAMQAHIHTQTCVHNKREEAHRDDACSQLPPPVRAFCSIRTVKAAHTSATHETEFEKMTRKMFASRQYEVLPFPRKYIRLKLHLERSSAKPTLRLSWLMQSDCSFWCVGYIHPTHDKLCRDYWGRYKFTRFSQGDLMVKNASGGTRVPCTRGRNLDKNSPLCNGLQAKHGRRHLSSTDSISRCRSRCQARVSLQLLLRSSPG